jgi:hypothetical protein
MTMVSGRYRPFSAGVFVQVPEPKEGRRSHRCRLPGTDYPVGTIWRCLCDRRWKLASTRQDTLMGEATHAGGPSSTWVRRILPWPRRPVAEALTRALENQSRPASRGL